MRTSRLPWIFGWVVVRCADVAFAQTFTSNTTSIPFGNPFNNSYTESVNFADVDLDGDFDAAFADTDDCCNDQSRLWVNNGGLQGGAIGTFTDKTAAQFPAVLGDGRDIEFADIDNDGDSDLYVSNTSEISNQTSRWWVNMGNGQGGTLGAFSDQTAARWVGIAGAGSSIAPSLKLVSGGFIDWTLSAAFADFDNDGDLDLFHSSEGGISIGSGLVPSRIFLNDGSGNFQEFNPSGFQLSGSTISNGNPGLWSEGLQQHDTTNATGQFCDVAATTPAVDLGDLDGDFDVDVLAGARNEKPRIFTNRLQENAGVLSFRDTSHANFSPNWSTGTGHYEQELGDLDNDGDLDIYGVNWLSLSDCVVRNNGNGTFAPSVFLSSSAGDDNESEWIDCDNDGDLDSFVAAYSGMNRMFVNGGAPNYSLTLGVGVVPTTSETSLGAAACDVDADGDDDLFTAENADQPNLFLENHTDTVDVHAPRIFKVEQAPARLASATPTSIRALIYDNESFYMTAQEQHQLVYTVDGGSPTVVAMSWAGGNVFRGELPGTLVGDICYRVRSTDFDGNIGESLQRCFHSGGGTVSVYCTSKVNSVGCYPQMSFSGVPDTASASGFVVGANNILNNKSGLFFYSLAGKQAAAFQGGHLCVKMPTVRTAMVQSAGNPPPNDCSGSYALDFNAYAASGADPAVQVPGTTVFGQWWQRDPGFAPPNNTGLTEAIEFVMQ